MVGSPDYGKDHGSRGRKVDVVSDHFARREYIDMDKGSALLDHLNGHMSVWSLNVNNCYITQRGGIKYDSAYNKLYALMCSLGGDSAGYGLTLHMFYCTPANGEMPDANVNSANIFPALVTTEVRVIDMSTVLTGLSDGMMLHFKIKRNDTGHTARVFSVWLEEVEV